VSIKILHINFSDSGGAAVASMTLHEELLKTGLSSKYLALNLTNNHPKDKQYYSHRRIYKSVFEKTWYLYIKAALIRNKNNSLLSKIPPVQNEILSSPYSTFDLTKDPLYQEADLIHFHFVANFLDHPSFFKKNKKPIIWTLHDRNPFSGLLHCKTGFPTSAQNIESTFIQKKKEWFKNNNITIVSPSNEYKTACLKSPVFQNCSHKVIHHGIPDEIFFPIKKEEIRIKHGLPNNKKIVLSVATDINRKLKGFEEILTTAKKKTDIIFILVGTKSKQIEEIPNIIYTGQIDDRSILNEWYNCADVTISNSVEESFGLSIAESLKTGTPIIMRKTGLSYDIISKENGMVFEGNLMDVLNDSLTVHYSKEKIINSVKNNLDIKKCSKEYIAIYEKLFF
jgi:glycosyltransferase involved in cell wall biosynthesis